MKAPAAFIFLVAVLGVAEGRANPVNTAAVIAPSFPECGEPASTNSYPWLAKIEIIHAKLKLPYYGVVVSDRAIITSGLCLLYAGLLSDIKVTFHAHNFTGEHISPVRKNVHRNFNMTGLKNNIAVLYFEESFLSADVKPICLWTKLTDFAEDLASSENNGTATVVGKNKGNARVEEIVSVDMKVSNPRYCMSNLKSAKQDYVDFGSICTEQVSNQAVRLGGYGSPLQLKLSEKWYLRGLYSAGFQKENTNAVLDQVFTFEDIARHVHFINEAAKLNLQNIPKDEQIKSKFSDPVCGNPVNSNIASQPLLAGGYNADIKSYPWLAAIYLRSAGDVVTFMCGGALISRRYVLTAAHCISNPGLKPENYSITFGTSFKKTKLASASANNESQDRFVKRLIPHENFLINKRFFDIGLMELDKEVIFSETVMPACIWIASADMSLILSKKTKIAGWGLTKDYNETSQLQDAEIEIYKRGDCNDIGIQDDNTDNNEMICAGNKKTGANVCNGDSGGPLMLTEFGRYYVRGIVSHGKVNEGDKYVCDYNYPALFTDVAKYRSWIVSHSDVVFEFKN